MADRRHSGSWDEVEMAHEPPAWQHENPAATTPDGAEDGRGSPPSSAQGALRHRIAAFAAGALMEQVRAVVPVCVFLAGFQRLVLGQALPNPERTAGALALAVVGLALFTFGLLNGLMPIGERLGRQAPLSLSLHALLVVAALLGVAVTLAEPALSVVKTAGSLIQQQQAPYLHFLLHDGQDLLVLAVAGGVGLSAALGMLRIRWGLGLKYPAIALVAATLLLSGLVAALSERSDVLGLAWDLGAVTTGPVTVPLVIALGVGVAQGGHNSSPLTGFGVVTLASLIPVNFVLLLTLALPAQAPRAGALIDTAAAAAAAAGAGAGAAGGEIMPGGEGEDAAAGSVGWAEQTPYLEAAAGVRALVPLVAFMLLLLRAVLRDSAPLHVQIDLGGGRVLGAGVAVPLLAAQVGIIVFNVGLTQGLARLGEVVGGVMPAAFAALPDVPGSPVYGHAAGVAVAVGFAFVLGFGATLAEPALATLAITVDRLSKGSISRRQVVLSVALGVGAGTALGLLKVIMQIPLLPLLLPGYALAAALSVPSQEVLVCVAWDSAGVTTGPVTVPLVISIGLGLGKGLGAADGFGILSLASVCPIVSVLAVGLCAQRRGAGAGAARGEHAMVKLHGDGFQLLGQEAYTHESDDELALGDALPRRHESP